MLSFEEFQIYVEDHIERYLPEDLGQVEISRHEIVKNNGLKLNGITVRAEGSDGGPTVYLNEPYENYKEEGDLDKVIISLAKTIEDNRLPKEFEGLAAEFKNFDQIKNRIVMVVVNADMNYELLKKVPHKRMVGDLAAIYKVRIDTSESGLSTCTITHAHKALWGISDAELHNIAMENSRILMPPVATYMEDILVGLMGYESKEEAMEESPEIFEIPEDKRMIVISNTDKLYGAGVIFYENSILETLTDKLGDKIYILPSSVHEVIAIRGDNNDVEAMESIVKDINANEVQLTDVLSDYVYMYDAQTKKISLANENIQQALVSEDNAAYQAEDVEVVRPRKSR